MAAVSSKALISQGLSVLSALSFSFRQALLELDVLKFCFSSLFLIFFWEVKSLRDYAPEQMTQHRRRRLLLETFETLQLDDLLIVYAVVSSAN